MTLETDSPSTACIVRTAADADEQHLLAAYLIHRRVENPVMLAPKDDDVINAQLSTGRYECVIFVNLEALLTAVWKGQGPVERWTAAGVRIELADPPTDDLISAMPFVSTMCDSLYRWRGAQRRKKIIAGVILSVLALIALGILLYAAPIAQ